MKPHGDVNAFAFAAMTILVAGIGLYSMGLIIKILIGWSLTTSIFLSAFIVLIYVGLGDSCLPYLTR